MVVMTARATTTAAARRLVLVRGARGRSPRPDAALRRHRHARVTVAGREAARRERFAHLKRAHD